jgi:hypothetical protein
MTGLPPTAEPGQPLPGVLERRVILLRIDDAKTSIMLDELNERRP